MSRRIAITHTVEQHFDREVRLSTHWLRLRPSPQTRARVTAYSITLGRAPHFINWVRDPFENHLARLDLPEPIGSLSIRMEMIADLEPVNPFDFLVDPDAARYPFSYSDQLRKELAPYLSPADAGPRLRAWLDTHRTEGTDSVELLGTLSQSISRDFDVVPAATYRPLDPDDLLERRRGSCWDLAWLFAVTLRRLGLASRLVSGYRVFLADGGSPPDAVSVHCWTEIYLPGAGWVGVDPAAGLFTAETYLPFASAPDPLRVLPIVGFREACEEIQTETLQIQRLVPQGSVEDTRWADVLALGRLVDSDLSEHGVRAALGVGLSLVAQDPGAAPEWSLTTLGPEKRRLAESLLSRLRHRLAPGSVVQHGQTRWYAGDALPRWQLGCYFRRDGVAIVREAAAPRRDAKTEDAARFARAMATALGLDPAYVVAAYEDPLRDLAASPAAWATPSAADLADPDRRRSLAERLSERRGAPAGHALPIHWDHAAERWVSGSWSFRRKGLYLVPGTSPLGYRLPLSSLVHDPEGALEAQIERSPFDERPDAIQVALPEPEAVRDVAADGAPLDEPLPRTAVCTELRDGTLWVFLPPVARVESYLGLVAAAEAACLATGVAAVLEGYPPPDDHRLGRLVLEPGPGVLRVSLPSESSFGAQVDLLEAVYQEAAGVGLVAERILPDGRRLPVGGESRLTLGGSQPATSPFLTRPELLGRLVAYFQRHPCLSYLFTGQAIGPSGQSSRPDEGRDEALYELSIGLEQLPAGPTHAPWLVDRTLRHLLTDLSGDLERAEIRTDELYPPDRAALRLGRIHIGSFETAPDARGAALQSLLALGLLGRATRVDERKDLIRWGPALHDKFMLPAVLWSDLRNVVADLEAAGYPFQLSWFEPLCDLRFPELGAVQIGEITLQLRTAHECWPLLAEQASAAGVARFIDMANERLQVSLSGLTPQRHVLACNGRRVPLRNTDAHGEYVAGVRYKVANPPATLHPTIPPVEALVFDVIDTWTGRAIGGCTYVPARPELWGAVGAPAIAPHHDPARGDEALPRRRVPPVPTSLPTRRGGAFLPRGSGIGPMAAPPADGTGRSPYLLDLTHR